VPVFVLVALMADLAAWVFGQASPGALQMVAVAVIGGAMATAAGMVVAYYGSIVTYRLGFDPDNYGIPLLTSSMDLVGALSLIFAIILVGIA
jgi:mgtE-like transporter